MSHFYARARSENTKEVTRRGTKNFPTTTVNQGQTSGVAVYAHHNTEILRDEFHVYGTTGSSGKICNLFLGVLYWDPELNQLVFDQ